MNEGGSYRTVQRFFNTVIPWPTICDLSVDSWLHPRKKGLTLPTGLSPHCVGKRSPASFLALSLVSIQKRSSYPMVMEQIVRSNASCDHVQKEVLFSNDGSVFINNNALQMVKQCLHSFQYAPIAQFSTLCTRTLCSFQPTTD